MIKTIGPPYVLGIDAGTESVRAAIFDLAGNPLIFHAQDYKVYFPNPGWAEQDPNEWWTALMGAVRGALAESGVDPSEIIGISADCTSCTMVYMDRNLQPLRRAIIWMDVRAAAQARAIGESGHPALKYNGWGNVSAEWFPCKTLWIKQNEPETYRQTHRALEYIDWVNYRLTGEVTHSINNVSIRWYYDAPNGGWQHDFFARIGLEDVGEKLAPRVLRLGEVVGGLRADVAAELGLKAGTPVAEGGADAFIAMLGLNVVKPGRMAFITGSSHLQLGLSAQEFHAKGIFGAYPDGLLPGMSVVEGGQVSTGSILKWFRQNFAGAAAEEAKQAGLSLYKYLDQQAEKLPPGSEGLILLDYWQGNRTPLTDPEARGMIWGFSLKHTTAHVYRAIMEGVAYGTEHIYRVMQGAGYTPEEVWVCGGAANSKTWLQIHADVSNTPIIVPEVSEAAVLGSAILAAVGAGAYPSIATAAEKMVRVSHKIEPNPAAHAAYKFYVDQYIATYPKMKELMHAMVRHVAGQT